MMVCMYTDTAHCMTAQQVGTIRSATGNRGICDDDGYKLVYFTRTVVGFENRRDKTALQQYGSPLSLKAINSADSVTMQ